MRHDTTATLRQLNAATTDVRQELTYKCLYLDKQESIFFCMIKTVAFSQSFWLFFPSSNKLFTCFSTVISPGLYQAHCQSTS